MAPKAVKSGRVSCNQYALSKVATRINIREKALNSFPMPPKQTTEKGHSDEKVPSDGTQTSFARQKGKVREIFSIPAPIKKLFDLVPVVVYPANPLPQRAPKSARIPSLYVFSKGQDAAAGRPSVNPSCLKWQVSIVHLSPVAIESNQVTDFLKHCRN